MFCASRPNNVTFSVRSTANQQFFRARFEIDLRKMQSFPVLWIARGEVPEGSNGAGHDDLQRVGRCGSEISSRQKGTPSGARATDIRRPAARRFGICPGVLCRRPCTNRLTKPSNYDRTHHEHGRVVPIQGWVPGRRWVRGRLLGEDWQVST